MFHKAFDWRVVMILRKRMNDCSYSMTPFVTASLKVSSILVVNFSPYNYQHIFLIKCGDYYCRCLSQFLIFRFQYLMKKLLSAYCCVLCFHSFRAIPTEQTSSSFRTSGERTLVKALSALVNREANQKVRRRRIDLSSSESPFL